MIRPLLTAATLAVGFVLLAPAPASADDDFYDDLEDYYEDLEDAREDYYKDLRKARRRGFGYAPPSYRVAPPVYGGGYYGGYPAVRGYPHVSPYGYGGFGSAPPVYRNYGGYGYGGGFRNYGYGRERFGLRVGPFFGLSIR